MSSSFIHVTLKIAFTTLLLLSSSLSITFLQAFATTNNNHNYNTNNFNNNLVKLKNRYQHQKTIAFFRRPSSSSSKNKKTTTAMNNNNDSVNDNDNNMEMEEDAYRSFISKDVRPFVCHEEYSGDSSNNKVLSILYKSRDLDENRYRTLRQHVVLLPKIVDKGGGNNNNNDDNDSYSNEINSNSNVPSIALSPMILPTDTISYLPSSTGKYTAHFIRRSPSQDQQTTTYALDLWKGSNMIKRIRQT